MNWLHKWASIILILCGAVCLSVCGDGSDSHFELPLGIGINWEYSDSFILVEYSQNTNMDTTIIVSQYYCEIEGIDTLFDYYSTIVYHFHSVLDNFPEPIHDHEYRNASLNGLYLYGHNNDFSGPPLQNQSEGHYYEFMGIRANSPRELLTKLNPNRNFRVQDNSDSIAYENPPIRELAYPLRVGLQWVYRDTIYGHAWNMSKKVESFQQITTPAGIFGCYDIIYLYDIDGIGGWDNDIEFHEYVSNVGIVKWDIFVSGIIARGEQGRFNWDYGITRYFYTHLLFILNNRTLKNYEML